MLHATWVNLGWIVKPGKRPNEMKKMKREWQTEEIERQKDEKVKDGQKDRQRKTERQTERKTERREGKRWTERQTERKTERREGKRWGRGSKRELLRHEQRKSPGTI
jgi:hypothetical protein